MHLPQSGRKPQYELQALEFVEPVLDDGRQHDGPHKAAHADVDAEEKTRIEAAISELRDVIKGSDKAAIDTKTAALAEVATKLAERAYAKAGGGDPAFVVVAQGFELHEAGLIVGAAVASSPSTMTA